MGAEKQSSKGQAWFCTTGLSSDIEVEVDHMTYHLNKVLLMSKSRKLHQLITEEEQNDEKKKPHEEKQEENGYTPQIRLENFPGGPEIFEMVVKICYGVKVNLSASTAVLLRCAAEELEMTEEYSPDNLVLKTENFLSHSVFRNTQETIAALKACESVSSLAESIGITKTCIDSIVSRASPSLFSWPMNNTKKQNKGSKLEVLSEDLSELSVPIFKCVVQAMKAKDLSDSTIETSLIRYAKKHIPGITSRSSSASSTTIASENRQRELLETIVSYLPVSVTSTTTTRSLFGLLRSAIILSTSEKCRTVLEKKIGSHLERATLDDLLIPSYSYLNDTLYDIDLVERLIRQFLQNAAVSLSSPSLTSVGKLIDGVLCEIASDANLSPERFYSLAVLLPDEARVYDDGLYRAIDIYLKSHPRMLEAEREKICSVMDLGKLTIEGCTHAAQNERLPLRAVVKVLFLEQLQLRTLVTTAVTEEDGGETTARGGGEKVEFGVWEKVVKENQVLRLDIDALRTRLYHLESEYLNLKEVIAKIDDKERLYVTNARPPRKWSIGKKFGCKFKTQVCDSHVAKMVDRRCQPRS